MAPRGRPGHVVPKTEIMCVKKPIDRTILAGGVWNRGTLAATDSTLSQNSAMDGGGGDNDGTLFLTRCTLTGNSASEHAGGLYNLGTATVSRSTFTRNTAAGNGGSVWNWSNFSATDSTFSQNSAQIGGAIDNISSMFLTHCTITGNSDSE